MKSSQPREPADKKARAVRKLKRHRVSRQPSGDAQEVLFPQLSRGRVELLKPNAEKPAIRKYVPPAGCDYEKEFERLGVIDLREPDSRKRCRIRNWSNRIICGDAASCLSLIPDASVACVVTSPPYWNTVDYGFSGQLGQARYEDYLADLLRVWKECERVLIPNGKLCTNTPIMPISKRVASDGHTRELKNLSSDIEQTILSHLSLRRYSLYIWQKQTTEKMFGSYPYPPNLYEQNTVEFISVLVKPGKPRKLPRSVKEASRLTEAEWMDLTKQVWWMFPEDIKRAQHPAPFPETLPNRLIAMYTFRAAGDFDGDLVFDPFCGTGATCLAAKRLGRNYLGIDLSPDFCIEAARRLKKASSDGNVSVVGNRA
jgi:DNA modification methylase